VIFSF